MTTVNARSPFLDAQSFFREEPEAPPVLAEGRAWSPFLSVYESPDGLQTEADEPMREAYATLVNDLYDEEFDEALFELLTSARSIHEDHVASGHSLAEADRLVTHHFSQLMRESESMLDSMAREFENRNLAAMNGEIDHFAERYTPGAPLEPEFQDFLGKLVKKIGRGIKSVATKAVKTVAQFAVGPVLARIKGIVRPLLNQVLLKAIGRLPQAVQPAARQLAQRLGLMAKPAAALAPAPIPPQDTAAPAPIEPASAPAEPAPVATPAPAQAVPAAPEDAGSPVQAAAGSELPELQLEFDQLLAEAMLSDDELEWELDQARAAASSESAAPVFTELDQARDRFVTELEQLKEGENPTPYVENFLPALLPALRIATRIIGRQRIVSFLAGLLGKLISNLVGPQQAPALANAMVDAGLKLLSLEASDQESTRVANAAVAATVEETIARVASLPDHVLENPELLEGFTLEAFEQAAAANLPALFSDSTYKKRPDLLEGGVNAAWVMLPLRRPRYKRCSRTFNVTITPHMSEAVETFEDTPLSEYLQDQLGMAEGEDVPAEIHLYEVVAGGNAADIARGETGTSGLGAADEVTLSQLHPLTQEAAGVLLGRPGLGRRLSPGTTIRTLRPGQRVFHMVVGRRPLTTLTAIGRQRLRRLARVNVALDVTGDQIRVAIFFSEVKAQRLAVRLRQQGHIGTIAVAFSKLLALRLPHILHGRRPRRLRIVHPSVAPGAASSAVLGRLPAVVPQVFIAKLQEWLTTAFTEFAKTQAQAFLKASEDPADGVTLLFTMPHPPGLKEIGQLLAQQGAGAAAVADVIANGTPPAVRVEAFPGNKRD